jgi:NADH-quinone oxidoreductase subunit L
LAVSLSQVFPRSAGFFSKDAILLSAYEHNKALWAIGVLTAALTAFYMFRLLFITFFVASGERKNKGHHVHESPAAMTIL